MKARIVNVGHKKASFQTPYSAFESTSEALRYGVGQACLESVCGTWQVMAQDDGGGQEFVSASFRRTDSGKIVIERAP